LKITKAIDQFDIIVIGFQESTFDIPKDSIGNGVSVPVVRPIVRGLKELEKRPERW
jgi:hypothetical protein